MGKPRSLRTTWDGHTSLHDGLQPGFQLSISYGSFWLTQAYDAALAPPILTRMGVQAVVSELTEAYTCKGHPSPEALDGVLDTALQPGPLECSILANSLCSLLTAMHQSHKEFTALYHRNRVTRKSFRDALHRRRALARTFEEQDHFGEAGLPSLRMGWKELPSPGWEKRRM